MRRNETIVRVFVDTKEEHGMCWTVLRGIKKYLKEKRLETNSIF
ncbi:transposase [Lysinibacillus sphaericus OT4b.31]|uniref:Transposase n=1 Tax=Lysinibacillus sphaericus OT4b.31 TaxID=1285586 RepID=R7ZIQ5_LYSSH|nr:transposase [Lysinibacillus sphaericus OT4b.31]